MLRSVLDQGSSLSCKRACRQSMDFYSAIVSHQDSAWSPFYFVKKKNYGPLLLWFLDSQYSNYFACVLLSKIIKKYICCISLCYVCPRHQLKYEIWNKSAPALTERFVWTWRSSKHRLFGLSSTVNFCCCFVVSQVWIIWSLWNKWFCGDLHWTRDPSVRTRTRRIPSKPHVQQNKYFEYTITGEIVRPPQMRNNAVKPCLSQ